jgi:energy-coupling factor transporter ATP-binding protein EcfA2
MELVTGPRILLLDEPTSGLDSFSANVLMQALQRTARRGCACVLTIHQPPVQIFDMFDRVLLLAPGGHSCFYGPPREALAFVSAQGVPPPSPWVNPAEFLLRVVAGEDASAAADAAALPEAFARSPLGRELARAVDACFGEAPAPPQQQQQQPPASAAYSDGDAAEPFLGAAGAAYSDAPRRASVHSEAGEEGEGDGDATAVAMRRLDGDARVVFVRARPRLGDRFLTLLGRGVRNLWRDPRLLLLQLTVTAAIALLMGVIFFDVNKQLSGIQNRVGLLFFLIIYFSFVSLSSIGVLVADRTLFLRERAAHYYDTPAYFAVKLLCDVLPLRVLPALALGAVVYWMVGLDPPAYKFLRFLLVLVLVNATATAVCFAVAAASRSVGEANLAASLFFIFSMLFGGLLLSNNQNSNRMVALRWASFFHYAYESLMANEFEDTQYLFNPRGIQPQNVNGDVVVQFYGLNPALVVADIYALLGFFLAFAALAFFFLARTRYQK